MDQVSGQSDSHPSKPSGSEPPRADAPQHPEPQASSSPQQVTINFSDAPGGSLQKPHSSAFFIIPPPEIDQQSPQRATEAPLTSTSPRTEAPEPAKNSEGSVLLKKAIPDIILSLSTLIVMVLMLISLYSDGWNSDNDSLRKMVFSDSMTEKVTSIIMLISGNAAILEYCFLVSTEARNPFADYSQLKRYKRTLTSIYSAFILWLIGVVAMCVCAGQKEYVGWPFILSLVTVPVMVVNTAYGCWFACRLKNLFLYSAMRGIR